MKTPHHYQQRGAALVIALVFLLILTTLAITNMREVTLEARITGNLVDQKQLFNAAEAGLRDGEYRTIGTRRQIPGSYDLATALRPLNALNECPRDLQPEAPCLINRTPDYQQFFDSIKTQVYSPDDVTSFAETINWYAIPAPGGADTGENENPEYGNMLMGIGLFRYEINSRAASDNSELHMRSTTARVYN
ncbi:pilus assembly protein PilX [Pseudomonas sp. WN033]|nr:pilus assembly protein PilX [Pseudomonas sp. WN033]